MTIAAYLLIQNIVRGSFTELEEADVTRHVERVTEAIDNQLADMDKTARDYSLPGSKQELLNLVDGLNNYSTRVIETPDAPGGIRSGVVDLFVNRLGGLNVLMLFDSTGAPLWERAYIEEGQGEALGYTKADEGQSFKPVLSLKKGEYVPEKKHLDADSPLLNHPGGEPGLKGLVLLPEGPMLVVSEYKLGSEGQKVGSVLMGKYLAAEEVAQLEELTKLSLAMPRIDELPADFTAVLRSLEDTPIFVQPIPKTAAKDEAVAGYTLQNDIYGNPALMIRADVPRDIMNEGNSTIRFLLYALAAVGVILVGLIAFLLDKLVLSRMASLNTQVSGINTSADLEVRVSMPGSDELSNLGNAINGMLGDIQTERGRAERLLLNVLAPPIAERLKGGETVIADSFQSASVLFSDMVGFTKLSARISAEELVDMLNRTFSAFDVLSDKHGLEKIKTIGDAYMVVGGVPDPMEDHAAGVAEMALDMHSEIARLNSEFGTEVDIRIGYPHRTRGGGGHRGKEVQLRPVGRRGKYGGAHGIPRHSGPQPDVGSDIPVLARQA